MSSRNNPSFPAELIDPIEEIPAGAANDSEKQLQIENESLRFQVAELKKALQATHKMNAKKCNRYRQIDAEVARRNPSVPLKSTTSN